jgi:hypothetical protein
VRGIRGTADPRYARQQQVPAFYKGRRVGVDVVDLIVEDQVVVEIKSVLINFNSAVLEDGIIRRAL